MRVVTEIKCKLEVYELEDGALCAADWDEVVGLNVHMIDVFLQEFQ